MTLEDVVAPHLDGFSGEIGLYIRHLETGEEFSYRADVPFFTASVFKIPVLVEVFRQAEAGCVTVRDLATLNRGRRERLRRM